VQDKRLKHFGIVGVVSKQAGALVGTAAAFGKKGVKLGGRGVAAAGDLFRRPVEGCATITKRENKITSEIPMLEQRMEYTTQRRMAALESDLAVTRRKLEMVRSREKNTNSRMLSEVGSVKTQAEVVLSIQGKDRVTVAPIKEEVASSMEAAFGQTDEDINAKIADQKSRSLTAEDKVPSPPDVTLEQVRAAVFSNATEKIIFTRAFSDISSQDAAARTDAARILAGIRHELSARTLVAQMACEPFPQVRQECIKALTALKMKEGLPAVKRALTDHDASVRLAAVWGLYHLAGIESAPMLLHMFSDDNGDVRRRAATCVGWLGQKELALEMLPLLADNCVSVRRAAVEAMSNLCSRQVIPFLIECLKDPEESIRKMVLITIETITGKKMCKRFPTNDKSYQRLIARWREWWKDEQPK